MVDGENVRNTIIHLPKEKDLAELLSTTYSKEPERVFTGRFIWHGRPAPEVTMSNFKMMGFHLVLFTFLRITAGIFRTI